MHLSLENFNFLLFIMSVIGLVVFVCLYFVEAGYGKMISDKWGPAINNKAAWVVMECPVFFVMLYLWAMSERTWEVTPLVMFLIFQTHYFQRSFIFPALLKGKSKMPIAIMLMGVMFNLTNGYIQGYWIF
ncbi:MAG: 3-oxo-5-alpha-steroid 4-dehydrogenase, partial [Paludibacteraceae bacterium]|nr:3-oxo-5-alpha-steroid 4-dehydrogenase [Paludibacteraceae bacterium]